MPSKDLTIRKSSTLAAEVVDNFWAKIEYRARADSFKWEVTLYEDFPSVERVHSADYMSFTEVPTIRSRKIDDNLCMTRLGAITWAKKVLRRERHWRKWGMPSKGFTVR